MTNFLLDDGCKLAKKILENDIYNLQYIPHRVQRFIISDIEKALDSHELKILQYLDPELRNLI